MATENRFTFRTEAEAAQQIRGWCAEQGVTESEGLRQLVMLGIEGCTDRSAWRAAYTEASMRLWSEIARAFPKVMADGLSRALRTSGVRAKI